MLRAFRVATFAAAAILTALVCGCSTGAPVILAVTGLSPSTVTAGSGAVTVHVAGQQFNARMTVLLGGTAIPTTYISAQQLDGNVPASLTAVGGSYALAVRDDSSPVGSATLPTTLSFQVTSPVPTATAVTPSTFLSGQASAEATVTGTNLLTVTTATVDGNARSVRYVDSAHVVVQLTADDLAYPKQHAIVLTNPAPGGGTTGAVNYSVANYRKTGSQYHAYGDSITRGGLGVTPGAGFAYVVAAANKLILTDPAQDGDMACDQFPRQIFPQQEGYAAASGVVYSLMVGTNETYVKGTGSYEPVYKACHLAALTWLALPRSSKVLAGDAGLTVTGGCTNTPDTNRLGVLYCAGGGGVSLPSYTTFGSPLYIWYYVDDAASASAGFSLLVDGATVGTYSTLLSPAISTQNGSTRSIAVARLALTAGAHTVNVTTTTGGVGILGFGTVPASKAGLSFLVMGDIPVQLVSNPRASTAAQQQYSADARADFLLATSDGLDLRFAPTREYMLGTAAEMADQLHPNDFGAQHLAAAFQLGFQGLNSSMGLVAQYRGGTTPLTIGSMALVDPPVNGAAYQLPEGNSSVTVGNIATSGAAAQVVPPATGAFLGGVAAVAVPAGQTVTFVREGAVWRVFPAAGHDRLTPGTAALSQ